MKKISVLLIVASMFFTLLSCSNPDTVDYKKSNNYLVGTNPYDSLGIMHNQLINYSRSAFLQHDSSHFLSTLTQNNRIYVKKEVMDTIQKFFCNYLSNNNYDSLVIQSYVNEFNELVNSADLLATINNTVYYKDIRFEIDNIVDYFVSSNKLSQIELAVIQPFLTELSNQNYSAADSIFNEINIFNYDSSIYPNLYRMKAIHNHSNLLWNNIYDCLNYTTFIGNLYSKNKIQVTERELWMVIYDTAGAFGAPYTATLLSGLAAVLWDTMEYLNGGACTCPLCAYYGI